MSSLLRAKDIVDVKDVITILVVVAIVLYAFAWLGQDPARVPRRLVLEAGVTDSVRCGQMNGKSLKGLSRRLAA